MLTAVRNKSALDQQTRWLSVLIRAVNFIADVPLQDDHRMILCSGVRKLFRMRYGPELKIRFSPMPGGCLFQGDGSRLMEGAPVRMNAELWAETRGMADWNLTCGAELLSALPPSAKEAFLHGMRDFS
jgi:hypothetical protein